MPSKPAKSWREKLARDNGLPKVAKLDAAGAKRWGGKTLVIPAPREVGEKAITPYWRTLMRDFAAALYSPTAQ